MQSKTGARYDFTKRYGVPEGWRTVALSDIADIIGGGTPSRQDQRYWGGSIPWVTPGDLTSSRTKYVSAAAECITELGLAESSAKLLPPGTILYTSRATIGAKAVAQVPVATNQGFASFIPTGINREYFFHLLDLLYPAIRRLAAGTTFDEISKRELGKVWCAIPQSEDEQEAIAQVVDAADEAIEQTRVAVKQAKQVERGVLSDLLSRGIHESGSLRSADDHIITSIGKLPAAWDLRRVGNEFDIQNGFTLNENRKAVHRKRRYLRVANVQRDSLKLADVSELEAKDQEFALRELQVDDLVVVEGHADRMQIGRCARITSEAAGMTFQNHLFRLRSKGRVDPYFGAIWLNSTYAQRYWNGQCATSSGLNTINQRMLKTMLIPVPPLHEQERIVQIVQGVRAALTSLKSKLAAQEALKAALLRDLLTGRVRVGAAAPATVVA